MVIKPHATPTIIIPANGANHRPVSIPRITAQWHKGFWAFTPRASIGGTRSLATCSADGLLENGVRLRAFEPGAGKAAWAGAAVAAVSLEHYPLYLHPPRRRPVWLRTNRLLGEHDIPQDSAAG
jgi:hypothetical protein